jgi:hypothetical protein
VPNNTTIAEHNHADEEVMAAYGITCVPTDRFHYKTYRYSRLSDALAQARQDCSLSPNEGK